MVLQCTYDNGISLLCEYRGRIQSKTWRMGSYAGVDYNITLCPLQSRLQHIYHGRIGQPYARVELNPMAESTLSPSQGLRIWPLYNSPLVSLRKSPTPFKRKKYYTMPVIISLTFSLT